LTPPAPGAPGDGAPPPLPGIFVGTRGRETDLVDVGCWEGAAGADCWIVITTGTVVMMDCRPVPDRETRVEKEVVTIGGGGGVAGAEADPEADPVWDWAGVGSGDGDAGVDDCADTRIDDNRRMNSEARGRCMMGVRCWVEKGTFQAKEVGQGRLDLPSMYVEIKASN